MRRQILVLAAVLTFFPLAAKAQSTALEVSGWERSVATTGTTYYRCRASTCDATAAVSFRPQQLTQLGTLAALRAQHEDVNSRMIQAGQGRVSRVTTTDVSEGENAGARVQTLVKSIDFSDGRREFMAVAMALDEGQRVYSIVSTAPSEAAARANLTTFLPVILLSGRLGGKPPGR